MKWTNTGLGNRLEYVVSMKRANTHYFDVSLRIRFEKPSSGPLTLAMPSWTPGHYIIDDFARNVLDVRATKEEIGEAMVEKRAKNLWSVKWAGEAGKVSIEYSVHAFEYHDTKSYIDTNHALINGASVFIYPLGMENSPIQLKLVPFPGWKRAASGLEGISDWVFKAPNLDVLIDSPIEVGNQGIQSFLVRGVEHQVSIFGEAPLDLHKFVEDLKKIVKSEVSIFRAMPYTRYVFLINFTDDVGGGLEHLNSTMCMVPRFRMIPSQEYNLMMSLFSHEFFHTWNVKRLRPKALGPFDYSSENYTKSLWVAEGITSYYDDYVLRRIGLYSVPEYLDAFAININQMKSLPGARWQSAQESSFDTWIKHYKPDSNSPNVTSSYYTQGAVIGWMLDLQIRKNTRGKKNLDHVMKKIYTETFVRGNRGYSEEEFEATTLAVGGRRGIKEVFDSRVRGRVDVNFDAYLGYAGLRLESKSGTGMFEGFLGVRLEGDGGRILVKTRLSGSPSEKMGLSVGDEVIAVNGLRLSSEKLRYYLSNMRPRTKVKVTIARNGMLGEVNGVLGRKPPFEYRIVPADSPTIEEKFIFRNWLMADWQPQIEYKEHQRSPDRKSTFDYL